jgi:nicotinate-nucleotide--dimethylbenzimidazole phosphoribosyltransferase
MGVNADLDDREGLVIRKVRKSTRNFAKEAAMTGEECAQAIETGIELAVGSGADVLGAGEMGICNTASASALYSMLLDLDPSLTVGPGTGSAGALLEHKKRVVTRAVKRHCASWDGSALEALERVGGYEIAGMVGLMLGGAGRRIPVVVDGFISSAAALVAMRLKPTVKDYLFFSHASAETFHESFLAREGIRPLLALDMRLGEGTGAVLAMQLIEQAMACYHEMATFSSAGVSGKEE